MFRRRRSHAHPPPEADAVPAPAPGGETHASRALEALVQELGRQRRVCLLDLGAAVTENVAFFSQIPAKLYIEDLYGTLARAPGGEEGERRRLLPTAPETPFDAVLAWDLFDYLDIETSGELARRLGELCRPGALLFALVGYLAEIPEHPMTFRVVDAETLLYGDRSPHTRPAPRHTPRQLEKLLAGFRLETSYLLRNGWREFLFVKE